LAETRYAGNFDVPHWVRWTSLDGHMSWLRLFLTSLKATSCASMVDI